MRDAGQIFIQLHANHFAKWQLCGEQQRSPLARSHINEGVGFDARCGGRKCLAPSAARLAEHQGDDDLTPRELEVLELIRDGQRNKDIAEKLEISEATVNFHVKNILDKLGANDRTHAVTLAVRRGMMQI